MHTRNLELTCRIDDYSGPGGGDLEVVARAPSSRGPDAVGEGGRVHVVISLQHALQAIFRYLEARTQTINLSHCCRLIYRTCHLLIIIVSHEQVRAHIQFS